MSNLKIYIVEDSPYVKKSLVRAIKEISGTEIIGVGSNVKEAIEFLRKNLTDLYIIDYNLPDGTGMDIIKKVKPMNLEGVYTVVSNFVDSPLKDAILKDGADYFFDKSTEIEELFELIEKLVKNRQ